MSFENRPVATAVVPFPVAYAWDFAGGADGWRSFGALVTLATVDGKRAATGSPYKTFGFGTPNRSYTVRAKVRASAGGASAWLSVSNGSGQGSSSGEVALSSSAWTEISATYVLTSATLSVATSTSGGTVYWTDIEITETSLALPISEGDLTLDKGVAPYGLASVTVPLMDEDLLEELDPYANHRVRITGSVDGGADERTFDLVMRNRVVNHADKTVELDLATDEAILQTFAPLSDDTGAVAFQNSLRGICNYVLGKVIPGAALEAGGAADVPFYVYADASNVVPNPRITGLADYAATRVSAILDTSWPGSQNGVGHNGVHLHTPTNSDSFVSIGGDNGAMRLGMAAGRTYTVSATGSVRSVIGGAPAAENDANGGTRQRSRSIVVHAASPSAPGGYLIWHSDQLPNTTSGNNAARVSVTFTLPADTTAAFIRAYHGGTSGTVTWSMFRLTETDSRPGVNNSDYFQGYGPNTASYAYNWQGAPDASVTRRVALINRAPELLRWNAGDDAWSFLEPMLTSAGLKLWCDELRRWWLTDPTEYSVPGRIVAQVSNTTEGTDSVDADDGPQLDGAIARFRWRDYQGEQQQRDDVAGASGRVRVFEFARPYPGPGTAAAIMRRFTGQKRTQEVTIAADYRVTPGQEISISLPGTADQLGKLQRVRWQLTEGVMDLASSGLTEVTPGSWLAVDDALTWTTTPDAQTWANS